MGNQLNAEKISREQFEMKYKSELEKSVGFSHEIEKVNNSKTSIINRIVELVENIGGESPTEVEDEEIRFRQTLRSIQDYTTKLEEERDGVVSENELTNQERNELGMRCEELALKLEVETAAKIELEEKIALDAEKIVE